MKNPNIHPIHARGIRSGGVPTLRGPVLTDAAILRYQLSGYYGEAARQRALASLSRRRPSRSGAARIKLFNSSSSAQSRASFHAHISSILDGN